MKLPYSNKSESINQSINQSHNFTNLNLVTSHFPSLSQKLLYRKLVPSLPAVNATKKIHNETTFVHSKESEITRIPLDRLC